MLAAAVGAAWSASAAAAAGDTVQTFASVTYSHDDNLFLLPDDAPGFVGPRDDNSRQVLVGVNVNKPFGRQVVSLQAKVSRVEFNRYSSLDYSGKDFSGDLEWHLANHLQGHVGGTYVQSLTSFADYHGQERDLRLERRVYANGEWRFHPSWRLRGGVSQQAFGYELKARSVNDRRENSTEAGVDYLAPSDSSIGLLLRHVDGIYPNPSFLGSQIIQDNYGQDEVKANVYWKLGAVTQAQFQVGWARRQHKLATYRDDSGINGRGSLFWNPTGRLKFTLTGWREFAAVESLVATSTLNKGLSLSGVYDVSAKVQMQGSYRSEKRDFSKISGLPSSIGSHDTTHISSIGVSYAAAQAIRLNLNATHNKRSGLELAGTAAYSANSVSASLLAQF